MRRKNSPLRVAIDFCGWMPWLVGLDDESKRRLELKDQPFKKG
jgi:hypothetical protein